jgi:hypothetical protein
MKNAGFVVVALMSTVCTFGCATEDELASDREDEELLAQLEGSDGKSDAISWLVQSAGDVRLGYEVNVAYTDSPRYRSVKFHANAGDELEIFVRGGGDATAWLFNSKFLPIGRNDDMNEDMKDANIEVASLGKAGDYYVVFRDKKLDSSTLKVAVAKVNLPANAPSVEAVGAAYEAALQAGTLASKKINPAGLPFLPKGLFERWDRERADLAGLQVGVYEFSVGGQTVWFVRKFLPGAGLEGAAYVSVGAMLGMAGGDDEHIDVWQN